MAATRARTLLFHWSPLERRKAIIRRGLMPGSPSTDRLWRPPFVCFADSPSLAWALSADTTRGRQLESALWDLWLTDTDRLPSGFEEILEQDRATGGPFVKEYRVYERVPKSALWFVGSRSHRGERD